MTDWNDISEGLLRTACSVDADVQFRLFAVRRKCEELEGVCQYIRSLETSITEEKTAQQMEVLAQQMETLAVQQSIQDAIQRARKVRKELITGQEKGEEEQKLQNILQVAKATRAAQQDREKEEKADAPPKIRLEYPRKLKALETQLEELQLKERESSTRFSFCCRMNEHLSLSLERKQLILQYQKVGSGERMGLPVVRIQMSYPKQIVRLRGGYQRLMAFMLEKVEVESSTFQQAAQYPSFASLFPIYHRLKQAKKMLRLLNSEAKSLLERLPTAPPKLSSATVAYRDVMLTRIRRNQPQSAVGVIDNEALKAAALKTRPFLPQNVELLDKLQTAWSTRMSAASDELQRPIDVYSTTVREIILTELSNTVLWSFKTYFTDTVDPPSASQVQAVMRLIRLVDSVALSQGRVYRSVMTPS